MYNWNVRRMLGAQFEAALEAASKQGWEIFSILPGGVNPAAPPAEQALFVIVARRPTA